MTAGSPPSGPPAQRRQARGGELRHRPADGLEPGAELRIVQQRMVDHEVADAVRQGRFRSDHPHEAARAVVTMCTALPTWWRPDGPLSPEQVAQQYVGFALEVMGCG